MNEQHLEFCASAEWAEVVEHVLLPWVLDGRPLGDQVLEVGAGPGLVTDALRQRVPRLVAVELDRQLAVALARRLAGSGVQVVQADATNLPFHRRRFSAVACFTMLHHVPTVAMQDQMLREFCRVLRPEGILVGTDGMDTPSRREVHVGDVFLPVRPDELPGVYVRRASGTRKWRWTPAATASGSWPPARADRRRRRGRRAPRRDGPPRLGPRRLPRRCG